MTITVCLLARNHADCLDRALKSVAPLADDVLLGDTGSTDDTISIAKHAGARVRAIPWADDFAAACNSVLDTATGDWILWLNPDEELAAGGAQTLRIASLVPDAFAYHVQVQQELRADRPGYGTRGWELRFFRRDPAVRYRGRLHPKFTPPLEDLAAARSQTVPYGDALIRRHAYLSRQSPEKLRFAVRLLEAELRDRPRQLSYLVELGRHLLWLNDARGHDVLAEAASQVRANAERPDAPHPAVGQLLEYLLTVSPDQSRSRITREEARELSTRWFPRTPPVQWAVARERFAAGDFTSASITLERLVALGQFGDFDTLGGGFDPDIIGSGAQLTLGICHLRLGNWTAAKTWLTPLLIDPTYGERAARLYAEAERQSPRNTI